MLRCSHHPLHQCYCLVVLFAGCGLVSIPTKPQPEEAKLAAQAARNYFRAVAHNYEQLSRESFATVSDAMRRNVELDSPARAQYGEALKAILQPRIVGDGQSDALRSTAPATFQAMAQGFAEVAQ